MLAAGKSCPAEAVRKCRTLFQGVEIGRFL
jgi:hypothetical protein